MRLSRLYSPGTTALLCFLQLQLLRAEVVPGEGPSGVGLRGQEQAAHEAEILWTAQQALAGDKAGAGVRQKGHRALKGKFLHITDLHADPFYKYHSSVAGTEACHRGKGPAGVYGAEITDCDSPFALINATFKWIEENIKDEIDFVVWTGDSARHDNDEMHPRDVEQIEYLNQYVVDKFSEVWGGSGPLNNLAIPVVPTYGNNDILPHNIFSPGPNRWTKAYLDIWRQFIPEEQRHSFERGGWFYVEVIPNRLAVFSLNSLYFFDNNAAVDGCAARGEPGYVQFEWLRIQLAFLRERGMKAIITGHVPPARTESKQNWDETCWQKYALWLRQYRDVVVGSLWGHMNIDHFMLQDFDDVDIALLLAEEDEEVDVDVAGVRARSKRVALDDEMSAESNADYLKELRDDWAKLPDPPGDFTFGSRGTYDRKKNKEKEKKFYKKIGGPWAERFSLGLVSPSVVPNYFPTLRIVEYNISGLESHKPATTVVDAANVDDIWQPDLDLEQDTLEEDEANMGEDEDNQIDVDKKKKKKKKNRKKKKKQHFKKPKGPSKATPPGPAYSPQTFTWLSLRQLYANLTVINNDFTPSSFPQNGEDDQLESSRRWKEGKHPNGEIPPRKPSSDGKPHPRDFAYELEYDTALDKIYAMQDLTVRSFVELAWRLAGESESTLIHRQDGSRKEEPGCGLLHTSSSSSSTTVSTNKDKHKHKKGKKGKGKNRSAWLAFVSRAFVGTCEMEELERAYGYGYGYDSLEAETEGEEEEKEQVPIGKEEGDGTVVITEPQQEFNIVDSQEL